MNDIAAMLEAQPELRLSYEDANARLAQARACAAKTKSDREKAGQALRVASLRAEPEAKQKLRKAFDAAKLAEDAAAEELGYAEALYADAKQRRDRELDEERQKNQDANFLELIEAVQAVDEKILPALAEGLQCVETAKRGVLKFCPPGEAHKMREIFARLDLRFPQALVTQLFDLPQLIPLRHLKLERPESPDWGAALKKKSRPAPSVPDAAANEPENAPAA